MTKCVICGRNGNDTDWIWQPFGPAEDANCFTLPGSHYRGFPAIRICSYHRNAFLRGHDFVFRFKYKLYWVQDKEVKPY